LFKKTAFPESNYSTFTEVHSRSRLNSNSRAQNVFGPKHIHYSNRLVNIVLKH